MVPSSSGLGHHPLKVEARVRIPLGLPEIGDGRRMTTPTKVDGTAMAHRCYTGRSSQLRLATATSRRTVRRLPARLARVGAANGDVTPVGGASGVPSPGARVPTRGHSSGARRRPMDDAPATNVRCWITASLDFVRSTGSSPSDVRFARSVRLAERDQQPADGIARTAQRPGRPDG